jgi:ferredoxin-NADP reductase
VREGDILWLKLPYGSFSFLDDKRDIILIAGGTGITPFVSFLEYAIDNEIDTKIRLYYGVRNSEYLIFDFLLHECKKILKNYKCHIFIETNTNKKIFDVVSKGMLSIQAILADTAKNTNSIYYLSGPQQMILNFRNELIVNDIQENRIMIDKWE